MPPGRLVVSYRIGGNDYEATDDGSGYLHGTSVSAGSVNYSSGAWSIAFASPPDNGTDITASYLHGEPGADWSLALEESSEDDAGGNPWGSSLKQVVLKNTGLSGQETVLVGVREWQYVAGNAHGWDLNGYVSYTAGQAWDVSKAQHGLATYDAVWERYTNLPMLPLRDGTMAYWIYSNRQRIVIVVRSQSRYESAYLGFGRRFGTPREYPAPLIVKGSATGLVNASDASDKRVFVAGCSFTYDGGYGTLVVNPESEFVVSGGPVVYLSGVKLQPHAGFSATAGVVAPTKDAARVLCNPVYVTHPSQERCLMDLDGVAHVACAGVQSEDTISFGGHKHRVFKNVFRSAYYDLMAIEEQTTSTTSSTTTTATSSSTSSSTTSTSP